MQVLGWVLFGIGAFLMFFAGGWATDASVLVTESTR